MEVQSSGKAPLNVFVGKEPSLPGSAEKMEGRLKNAYAAAVKGRAAAPEGVQESLSTLHMLDISEAKERALFKKIDRFAQGYLS
ncbi:hypothetical protein [Estrella lausannensis]|uniref:Uncharacterized protein n=1 Tax=Estrella lausannensis TaxID=483423 RepID=A0A0H5DRM1_9BACT|nr:hypothetical protein [Estrella lausannensis]CRX38858.1 hypothetical protein ELAC_1530 [Estrella lausannensis]